MKTTETKHTPGPWKMAHVDGLIRIRDNDGDHVADCYFQSDAHLITSAPDLLSALEEAAKALEWCRDAYGKEWSPPGIRDAMANARAAISRARAKA